MRYFISLLSLIFLVNIAQAKELTMAVNLAAIKSLKSTEARGDEVYISVTKFKANDTTETYTIPEQPLHWPSRVLDKIKNLELWSGTLKDNQRVEVLFSVVDHDNPPWNNDDLIGTVKLKLINRGNKLDVQWSTMDSNRFEAIVTPGGTLQRFTLTGEHSKYLIDLMLVEKENGA